MTRLKNNRCADSSGMIAEMLKYGGTELAKILCNMFNAILNGDDQPPEAWKKTILTVLFQSGGSRAANNYRPIAIIPTLYKLFARLLFGRLSPILDSQQCPDQAGFRADYSTVDHFFTIAQLHEKSNEFQLNLWTAAIDFQKAFDSIEHDGIWHALESQGVPHHYIWLLRRIYSDQAGMIRSDVMSKQFSITRGVKQGDPLSSLLFNSLLEHIMRAVKPQWVTKRFGMQTSVGQDTRLMNLRFADDLFLIGKTQKQILTMLEDVIRAARTYGLELHPEKTKILTNVSKQNGRPVKKSLEVDGINIEVLAIDAAIKYLGRMISFSDFQGVEIQNRIRATWGKFMCYKQELTNKNLSLNSRLRLFDGVVSPTLLYGSEAWALTKDHETLLQRTQRRMLRMFLAPGRRIVTHTVQSTTTGSSEDSAE